MTRPDIKFDWVRSLDPRNDLYPMRAELAGEIVIPDNKQWRGPYWRIDQSRTPRGPIGACVGFARAIDAMSMPVLVRHFRAKVGSTLKPFSYTMAGATDFALAIYDRAQALDEFRDTPPAEGSSVNGGMLAAREAGLQTGHVWARQFEDVRDWIATRGPVNFGTTWGNSMFDPDEHNVLHYVASEGDAGGHSYIVSGYRKSYWGQTVYTIDQSWGSGFGDKGRVYIDEHSLRGLFEDGGEAAVAVGSAY